MSYVYLGVFLTDEASKGLVDWWRQEIGEPLGKIYAHHMTVVFKPTEEQIRDFALKQECTLRVIGYAHDAQCQAVVVRPSCAYGIACQNAYPHITIATEFTPPGYSNELLQKGPITSILHGPTLQAWTGYFDGKQVRYEHDG